MGGRLGIPGAVNILIFWPTSWLFLVGGHPDNPLRRSILYAGCVRCHGVRNRNALSCSPANDKSVGTTAGGAREMGPIVNDGQKYNLQ